MKAKTVLILITTALIFTLSVQEGALSQEKDELSPDAAGIMRKLDEILDNQAKIFEQIDMIKQELEIIKVRASR